LIGRKNRYIPNNLTGKYTLDKPNVNIEKLRILRKAEKTDKIRKTQILNVIFDY